MSRWFRLPGQIPALSGRTAAAGFTLTALSVAVMLATACALLIPAGSRSVLAQSDGNGLDETSVNTFLFDASRDIVRVDVDITLTNVTTDRVEGNVINQRYWDSYYVAVPLGAENIVATMNGVVLDGELTTDPDIPAYSLYQFPLQQRLFSGQSARINVTYDHFGASPRDEVPWRVNAAYAGFVAFGLGDAGQVTIEIVKPIGYEFDQFTDLDGYVASEPDGFGSIRYVRTGVDGTFETVVGMYNDERLVATPLEVDGADVELRSWPGDRDWADYAARRVESGIPALEELIGFDWPIDEPVEVRQTVEPNLYGYAGWFDLRSNEIAVGEELDADTIYHELSHAWLNGDLAADRWVTEGLAQVYAAELVRRDGGEPAEASAPDPSAAGAGQLADWSSFDTDDGREAYGYNASFWLMDALADDIGFDALRDVLVGLDERVSPYDTAVEATPEARPNDWNRVFDMLVEVGGSSVAPDLFERYVLDPSDVPLLADRAAADAQFESLADRSAPWEPPEGVRHSMELWEFDDVAAGIAAADGVLALRSELDELADTIGLDHPDTAEALYESAQRSNGSVDLDDAQEALETAIGAGEAVIELDRRVDELAAVTETDPPAFTAADVIDFSEARALLAEQVDMLDRLDDTMTSADADAGALGRVGLIGTDVDGDIDRARAAIAAGDLPGADRALDDANATLDGAVEAGAVRAAGAVAAAVVVLGTLLLIFSRRRRRRSRRRLVGGVERVGSGRGVELDEDALTWTHLGGVDHTLHMTARYGSEASGTSGIVQRSPGLRDVGDAVLELDEDVVAVVDADPVAGAEVLIDPDAHDSEGR